MRLTRGTFKMTSVNYDVESIRHGLAPGSGEPEDEGLRSKRALTSANDSPRSSQRPRHGSLASRSPGATPSHQCREAQELEEGGAHFLGQHNNAYLERLKYLAQYHRNNLNYHQARIILEKIVALESIAFANYSMRSSTNNAENNAPEIASPEDTINSTGATSTSETDVLVSLMVSYTNLACLCFEMGDLDAAMINHNAALKVYLKGCPACHSIAALAVVNLRHVASIYIRCRMSYEALRCYSFIYDIQQEFEAAGVVPKSEVAATLSCMGLMNYMLKKYPAALRFYQEELRLRLEIQNCSTDSEDVAISLNSIGIVHFQMQELEEAEKAFRDCLRIRQSLLGDGFPIANNTAEETPSSLEIKQNHCFDLAMVYYNLGGIGIKRGDTEGASELYQRSMELKKAALGNSPEIAVDYQHLGQTYLEHGDTVSSIGYYKEALKVLQSLAPVGGSGENVDDAESRDATQKLLVIIGNVFLMEGNVPAMIQYFEQAARMAGSHSDFTEICHTFGFHYYSISRLHPRCASVA